MSVGDCSMQEKSIDSLHAAPTGCSVANQPQAAAAVDRRNRQTDGDGRTDGHPTAIWTLPHAMQSASISLYLVVWLVLGFHRRSKHGCPETERRRIWRASGCLDSAEWPWHQKVRHPDIGRISRSSTRSATSPSDLYRSHRPRNCQTCALHKAQALTWQRKVAAALTAKGRIATATYWMTVWRRIMPY